MYRLEDCYRRTLFQESLHLLLLLREQACLQFAVLVRVPFLLHKFEPSESLFRMQTFLLHNFLHREPRPYIECRRGLERQEFQQQEQRHLQVSQLLDPPRKENMFHPRQVLLDLFLEIFQNY